MPACMSYVRACVCVVMCVCVLVCSCTTLSASLFDFEIAQHAATLTAPVYLLMHGMGAKLGTRQLMRSSC